MALHTESMTQAISDLHAPEASSSSVAVVQALYAAMTTGPLDSVGAFLADDVEFELHDATGTMNGAWTGRESVLAALAENFAKVDQQKPAVKGMIAEGNTVAVLFSETGVLAASRQPYNAVGVQWFTIDSGKVRRVEEIISLNVR